MREQVQQVIQHKNSFMDGGMVVGGVSYASFADSLPIIIGVLTAILFVIRIMVAYQEYRINQRKLGKKK